MVDLVSIGASGVNVYKRALATVSNNIANMGTDGYSRQVTEIRQNAPTEAGKSTIGNGAYFNRVTRQYDEFLEASLQQATSDFESQGATVEFARRLLDLIGSEKIGASAALTKFFGSAKNLSTDPASSALRNAMLRDSDELVSRFNGLADQIDELSDQAYSALEADVKAINGLSSQIAAVNQNLLKKRNEADQPPQLLDLRDQLLRDLSEYVGIKTVVDSQGLVSVSLTQTMNKGLLVDKVTGYQLAASERTKDNPQIAFTIKGGLENVSLSGVSAGSVAGYANFLENTVAEVRGQLNKVVRVFADEVNAIQTTGLDGMGRVGSKFFEVEPSVDVDKGASRGDYEILAIIGDATAITSGSYGFTWDTASGGWVPDAGISDARSDSAGSITFSGLTLRTSGQPLDGDRFIATTYQDAAAGIRVALEDGVDIAASSLFRITPAIENTGSLGPTVSFNNYSGSDSLLSDGIVNVQSQSMTPAGVIGPGQSQFSVTLDSAADANLTINLLTSDGRHLVGGSSGTDFSGLVGSSDFFADGASYSDLYLNKSGPAENSYKDLTLRYGAFGDSREVTYLSPLSGDVVQASNLVDFAGGFIDFSVGVMNNGVQLDIDEDTFIDQTQGAISVVGDSVYRGTGSGSERIAEVVYPFGGASKPQDTLRVNLLGSPIVSEFENASFEADPIGSETVTGWSVLNQQIILGTTEIAGFATPMDSTTPPNSTSDSSVPTSPGSYSTTIVSDANDGSKAVQMDSSGITAAAGYDVVRGPAIYSDSTVSVRSGDSISFDWKAQGGGDDYDVFGYFINETTGDTHIVLDETGTTSDWTTVSFDVPESGDYRFVFVSGSFDASGGQAMGARLFVDNLVVDATPPPPQIDVTALNQIATKLTLATGNDLVNTSNPEIAQISVEAVTADSQYQTSKIFDLNTDDLVELGAVVDKGIYRSEIIGKSIPAFSGAGDVIAAGEILLNGTALGPLTVGLSGVDGYGRMSALDIKSWLDSASLPEVNVKVWNRVFVPEDSVQLTGAGIKINGTRILSSATGLSTSFDSLSDIVASINAQTATTGVEAILGDTGFIQLTSDGGNIELAASTDAASNNQLGVSNGVFVGEYRIRQNTGSDKPISLELIGTGTPSDLNAIGLDTTVTVTGAIDEKIGVFIQGSNGSAASTLDTQLVSSGVGLVDGIRDRVYELDFINADTYRITDTATETILAERDYDGETLISYQGIQIYLDRAAEAGDRFTIDGNNTGDGQSFDAQGNNDNILRVVSLENQPVIGGKSLAESYLDFIGEVGNQAVQAEISQDALAVLRDQAIEARDRVSGVNLDQEAADLIKFQQAYQASAQILQVATKLFDAMLQVR